MNKVIVVLNNIRMYDQFLALPPVFKLNQHEYRMIITDNDPHIRDVSRNGKIIEHAHDLRFVYVWNEPQLPFKDEYTATINIHRLPKGEQMERLTRIVNNMDLTYFFDLGFSVIDFKDFKVRHRIDPKWGSYVLKPTGGARSMGVFYIDKPINLKTFIVNIRNLRTSETTENSDYLKLCDEFGVRVSLGEENYQDEATRTISENTLMIQQMNPFQDVKEFRAIVGAKEPLLIRRTHFDNPNDRTVFDEVITEDNVTDYFSKELYDEIIHFLTTSNLLPHGSIDIWYSREENRWGIYEYQCQFGHVFIPEQILTDYLMKVIEYQYMTLGNKI